MERIDFDGHALDARHHLLLDPLQGDVDAMLSWQDFPLRALAPPGFDAQSRQLPSLLAWQDLSDVQRTQALRLLTDRDEAIAASLCVGLLQSDAVSAYVRAHLRQLLVPHFPDGARGVFRFYDPVVFLHLGWMLDAGQRSVLFGPVSVWTFPSDGAWFAQSTPLQGSHHVRFAPGEPVWRRIGRIGAVHAALETELAWRAEPLLYGPQVEAWLVRAEAHGLSERDDVVAFVRHGMLKHPGFDTHPEVMATLQQCAGHPTRYRRLTSLWSDDDWRAIVRDLERAADARRVAPANTDHSTQGAS
ncbi:MAG: hypothetical protein GAK33_00963 [Burkholderia lata]|uniref:DUF4123 domain-containing protein n=1 Tax=Burkholderia lata (strain ATCC 17760 / DSM 23089 / LMG 22485 / NCIMB 9086 / R18194 / 383) TaxID=482957 RepID=A0A833PRP6_BURL3|nr:DUF4123 domain-containing protein [Burkholderia lata]KAF1039963.1 MAG: hypothetical protein GAK33_00963 [Burkholderia lata]